MTLGDLPQVAVRNATDAAAFQREIMAAEKPVVLKGLIDHWPALAAGRQSASAMMGYLKAMDRGALAPVMEAPFATGGRYTYAPGLSEFTFSKRQGGISETLDRISTNLGRPDAPFIAIQMLPLDSHLPDFVRANPAPLLPAQVPPRLWIGGPLKTQTHNDRDHNLACVIAGRRRFLLFPPEQVANLYVGPLDAPPPLSLVDPEAPDFERFPRFCDALAAASVAWLDPGDCLFLPKYWWHHVTSLDPFNAMVNYWWGDTATGLERASDGFLTALLAFKDLPPGQRRYWQAMFDMHVFGDGGASEHIPPDRRGVLGPLPPAVRTRLKQELKMAYLKGG
jgi:hypothetical protein